MRAVHVANNKDVFNVTALPLDEYAASLGLPGSPQVKFGKGVRCNFSSLFSHLRVPFLTFLFVCVPFCVYVCE